MLQPSALQTIITCSYTAAPDRHTHKLTHRNGCLVICRTSNRADCCHEWKPALLSCSRRDFGMGISSILAWPLARPEVSIECLDDLDT